jgi:phosphate starvation-inducible protein PhoH and related proteins
MSTQLQDNVQEIQETLQFRNAEECQDIFGASDEILRLLQQYFSAKIVARGDLVHLIGVPEEVSSITLLLKDLRKLVRQGNRITKRDVDYLLSVSGTQYQSSVLIAEPVKMHLRGKKGTIKPRTLGQRNYLNEIAVNDIVFGVGPAGTGKTYLAMAAAVSALEQKQVRRIILARPAVEAGESLGYLPGDLQAKVDPFLRPLYDALYDMLSTDVVQRYIAQNIVEIAPLAYMRGRTLNNSFIILDEAQNTTPEQMKMFLTRLGFDSKVIITGDTTQVDLPSGKRSGLIEVCGLLNGIEGISFVYFTKNDIVRHPLVQKIVHAYETRDEQEPSQG